MQCVSNRKISALVLKFANCWFFCCDSWIYIYICVCVCVQILLNSSWLCEKRGKWIYFGRFPTADVFFLSCVSQDPDICQRKNFLFLPYFSSPNQPDCLSIYSQPDSEQIFIFLYSKDFQGEKMSNRTKKNICKEQKWWRIHDCLHWWGWNAQKLSQTHPARLSLGSAVLLRELSHGICQTLSSLSDSITLTAQGNPGSLQNNKALGLI